MQKSLILRLLLAVVLVFAQYEAVQHAFEHDRERVHATAGDNDGHHAALCAKCLAIAHLDHADGGFVFPLAVSAYSPPLAARVPTIGVDPVFVAVYRSRAPPVLS